MKKTLLLIPLFLSLSFLIQTAEAATVTGEARAKVFGNMSMDVTPGVIIEDKNTPGCDEAKKICYMKGVSWADVIGWTAWEGNVIKTEVEKKGGAFPEAYFSKVTYNGSLGGFIWGDKTGWVQLSACNALDQAVTCNSKPYCQWSASNYCEVKPTAEPPAVENQNDQDWGAYIDFCSLKTSQPVCESATSDPYCNWDLNTNSCLFDQDNNPEGQPLRGFAWSERLGWVKFGVEAGDQGFKGVFTNWPLADPTAPEVTAPENAWIPNKSPIGTLAWTDFAAEPNSKINLVKSDVDYVLDPDPIYAGCNTQGGNKTATIVQENSAIHLYFPTIGLVDETVAAHHCKYNLSGVLYNSSNYGYFFGADAEKRAGEAGIDVKNPLPNIIDPDPIHLFSLAGDFAINESKLKAGGSGVADGIDVLHSNFSPRDIAGNPIAPIPFGLDGSPATPDTSVRNVYLGYHFDGTKYLFDSVEPENNFTYAYPAPISIGTDQALYPAPGFLDYPKNGPDENTNYLAGNYSLDLRGFAPTEGTDNVFSMETLDFLTNSKTGLSELPALSPSMPAVNLINSQHIDKDSGFSLPFAYHFKPAVEVVSGKLNEEIITLDQEVEANYELKNNSVFPQYIANQYGVDQVMNFKLANEDKNQKSVELRDINLLPLSDAGVGRTDRKAGFTRFLLWHDSLGATNLSDNEFHTPHDQFHAPHYSFEDDPNGVGLDGQYEVDGKWYADPNQVGPFPPLSIDRTDELTSDLASLEQKKYSFTFRPSQYSGQLIDPQLEFSIDQYVAYKPQSVLPQFAIYPAIPFVEGVKLKTLGLGTSGVVTGEQVFEPNAGRDLNNVTLTSSADLRKEMRKNVAQMTRNMNLEKCTTEAHSPLEKLPTAPSSCVRVDEKNKTIVAVYKEGTLTLGDGQTIVIPEGYKYTLILMDGANLYLKENMAYEDSNSSLGMIVLQDPEGKGGNVYVNPSPTNMAGLLYAEGSILSSSEGTEETLFYSKNTPSLAYLSNQLYWQGSIASRNTIGGAPNMIRPAGVSCDLWPDAESCAKAFDLDFLRRFTVYYNKGKNAYYTSGKTLFSGGGICDSNLLSCTSGPLATTVDLGGPDSTIDIEHSKSLNTFFIERDNRPAPPGFTVSGGFTSSQEIR